MPNSPLHSRFVCPCCGYPTLDEMGSYDICELCGWEDSGQGDANADEVRGGPNSGYSLTEARQNFLKY
ncbi:MAG: hydrolase [Pseudomonadales bacterium]|nr:hydrolase [Pseudomonadales bacterium]